MATIKYDGHSFNKEYVASFKKEADFLKEADEPGHKVGWFADDKNRKVKLKEVYSLAIGKPENKESEEPAE